MHDFAVRVAHTTWPQDRQDRQDPRDRPGGGDHRQVVLAIDGSSGAGKTTLAACVAAHSGAHVFHMDDIYPGWTGLDRGAQYLVDWVLHPLSQSRPAVWRRFDWHAGEFTQTHTLSPGRPLIVEGVGAYSTQSAPYLHTTVWVEAPTPLRRIRVDARDGPSTARTWPGWAAQERSFHRRHRTRESSDLQFRN